MTACKLCGAEIVFVRTRVGARMPLDVEPHDDGTVEVIEDEDGEPLAVLTGNLTLFHQEQVRYRPHWATCTGDIEKVRKR